MVAVCQPVLNDYLIWSEVSDRSIATGPTDPVIREPAHLGTQTHSIKYIQRKTVTCFVTFIFHGTLRRYSGPIHRIGSTQAPGSICCVPQAVMPPIGGNFTQSTMLLDPWRGPKGHKFSNSLVYLGLDLRLFWSQNQCRIMAPQSHHVTRFGAGRFHCCDWSGSKRYRSSH